MTTLSIGVVGTGSIGTQHVRRLARQVAGSRVHAVFDLDADRARSLATEVGAFARHSVREVVEDPDVEAVLVASSDESHAEITLACIAAGKPVLCEKPLATTVPQCRDVLDAETAAGRRLVQVGFMRRYDECYGLLKTSVERGDVGDVLLIHCVHRNVSSPPTSTSDMSFTSSAIHEFDVTRWLLGEEVVAATVVQTRSTPLAGAHLRDPQLVLLETASGVVVEVEVFVNCQYGYDVRCEVVGSLGTVSLGDPSTGTLNIAGTRRQAVPADWRVRFAAAYRDELQRWVNDVRAGVASGPNSWDGYAATAVAEGCVRSLETGERTSILLGKQPGLYVAT